MSDLRERLELESHRVSLAPGADERMFERRDRRDRRRRFGTVALGLALVVAVVALVVTTLPRSSQRHRVPASPTSVIGTYTTRLLDLDPDVSRLGLKGEYVVRFDEDGEITLSGPLRTEDLPLPLSTFSATDREFVTDLLVGKGCAAEGTYRWSIRNGLLTLVPVADPCELRSVILATRPWVLATPRPAADVLQGDWVATFTCETIVRAVQRAPVPSHDERFWLRVQARELGSPDPADPCVGTPPPLSHTFRFSDGRLQIFDPPGVLGFDGIYEITGDLLTLRDRGQDNIEGTAYRVAFHIEGDRLTFDLLGRGGTDPFFVGAWESAEFVRVR
jgi:hypothetical protein